MDIKVEIIKAAILVFNEKGIKFTMDDLAKALKMSKKTIYTVFRDKKALLFAMVDHVFREIKKEEQWALEEAEGDTLAQLKAVLCAMPDRYRNLNLEQLYTLKEKYPSVYDRVEWYLEHGWESTIELLEKGMEEGLIRKVNIPIVKMMIEASLEQFFQRDILVKNRISYHAALEEVVDIILNGITEKTIENA